jgi:hypothetical protein
MSLLRESKDSLLEDEFGVAGTHLAEKISQVAILMRLLPSRRVDSFVVTEAWVKDEPVANHT